MCGHSHLLFDVVLLSAKQKNTGFFLQSELGLGVGVWLKPSVFVFVCEQVVRKCNEGARRMERTEMMYTINSQLDFKIKV